MALTSRITPVAFAISLSLLSACGGGGSSAAPAPDAGATPATPATPPGGGAVVADADLAAFAAAWTTFQMLESLQMLQVSAGGSGNCANGGSIAYNAASGVQSLSQCLTRQFPYQRFSGHSAISSLVATPDRGTVTAMIGSPLIEVADAVTGQLEYTLTGGSLSGQSVDSDAGNTYFWTSTGLQFHAGSASDYSVSNAGSTATAIGFSNGQPERSTSNLVYTTALGANSWQVTVTSPVRELGSARPDRGNLMIVKQGATQALNVAFSGGDTLTFSGGAAGQTRTLHWNDSALQAAFAAGRR